MADKEKKPVISKEQAKSVVCKEAAEQEFDSFCEAMDIDNDESEFDQEDLAAFTNSKRLLVKAIMGGYLAFNDECEAVYTPKKAPIEPLTFHESGMAELTTMDRIKKGQDMKKTLAVIAAMTKTSIATVMHLKGLDYKVTQAIFTLLMG